MGYKPGIAVASLPPLTEGDAAQERIQARESRAMIKKNEIDSGYYIKCLDPTHVQGQSFHLRMPINSSLLKLV